MDNVGCRKRSLMNWHKRELDSHLSTELHSAYIKSDAEWCIHKAGVVFLEACRKATRQQTAANCKLSRSSLHTLGTRLFAKKKFFRKRTRRDRELHCSTRREQVRTEFVAGIALHDGNMPPLFILTETSAGYALFKSTDKKLLKRDDIIDQTKTAEDTCTLYATMIEQNAAFRIRADEMVKTQTQGIPKIRKCDNCSQ